MVLTMVIPVLAVGTMKIRSSKIGYIKRSFIQIIDTLTAIFDPIRLNFKLILAKVVKNKILITNNNSLAGVFKKQTEMIKDLRTEIVMHIRLQQGLETIYQLIINVVLIFYAKSKTKTSQGLSALFEGENVSFMGISISAIYILAINLALNMIGFTSANLNGIRGHADYFPLVSKLLLSVCILCSILTRILAITMFFAPALGLFNLLYHYKGNFKICAVKKVFFSN